MQELPTSPKYAGIKYLYGYSKDFRDSLRWWQREVIVYGGEVNFNNHYVFFYYDGKEIVSGKQWNRIKRNNWEPIGGLSAKNIANYNDYLSRAYYGS